jgi:hypothetical protein
MGGSSRTALERLRVDDRRPRRIYNAIMRGRLSLRPLDADDEAYLTDCEGQFRKYVKKRHLATTLNNKETRDAARNSQMIQRFFWRVMCGACQEWRNSDTNYAEWICLSSLAVYVSLVHECFNHFFETKKGYAIKVTSAPQWFDLNPQQLDIVPVDLISTISTATLSLSRMCDIIALP